MPIKNTYPKFVLCLLLCSWVTVQVEAAQPKTVKVDCDKGKSLQEAIDKASDGDEIEVTGTCNEFLVFGNPADFLTLTGTPGAAIVSPDSGQPTIDIREGSNVNLSGLSISGGDDGVVIRNSTAFLRENVISAAATGVLTVANARSVLLDNTIQDAGVGIRLSSSASAFLIGTTLEGITNIGLDARRGSEVRVFNLTVAEGAGTPNVAIRIASGSSGDLTNVTIEGTPSVGVDLNSGASASLRNLTMATPNDTGVRVTGNASLSLNLFTIGTMPPTGALESRGIHADLGGSVSALNGTIVDQQFGVVAEAGGVVDLGSVTLTDNYRGIWVPGGSLRTQNSTIQGNTEFAIVADRGDISVSGDSIQGGISLDDSSTGQVNDVMVDSLGLRLGAFARVEGATLVDIRADTNSTLHLKNGTVVTGTVDLGFHSVLEVSGGPADVEVYEITCAAFDLVPQVVVFDDILLLSVPNATCNVFE